MMNLNLGCFDQIVEGWVNTDVTPHIFVARIPMAAVLLHKIGKIDEQRYEQHRKGLFKKVKYLNVKRRFPFSDGTFDNVFCSYLLEHLYKDDVYFCIREVYRVLKEGGVFRVSVPDLDIAVKNYDPCNPEPFLQIMYESEQKRDKNRHHWMYNEHQMRNLLSSAGFCEVYRCAYREGGCADLIRLDNRPEKSLFMEAIK